MFWLSHWFPSTVPSFKVALPLNKQIVRQPPLAPPSLLNEKLCQWSSSVSPGLTVQLSWVTGEAANPRPICSLSGQWQRRRERKGCHTVAKTTTFEWVCSWNAARQRLHTRLKGGGSGGRAIKRGIERDLFSIAFYLLISLSSIALTSSRNSQ